MWIDAHINLLTIQSSLGEEWINIFKQFNSGTYNNQWLVVNYNLFTPGQPLPDGVLHIAEQIPTRVEHEDVTHYLRLGYTFFCLTFNFVMCTSLNKSRYWPSYNIPYFESIFNESGFIELERTYGYTRSCMRLFIPF